MQDKRDQTTPSVTLKRKNTRNDEKETSIIQRVHPTGQDWMNVKKKWNSQQKKAVGETQGDSRSFLLDQRKIATKAIERHARPHAIKIKALGEVSYANILRRIKFTFDLAPLGEQVTHIRRTRAEHLLEEGRPGKEIPKLQTTISATLKVSAAVVSLTR